jgi:hypothetical protein
MNNVMKASLTSSIKGMHHIKRVGSYILLNKTAVAVFDGSQQDAKAIVRMLGLDWNSDSVETMDVYEKNSKKYPKYRNIHEEMEAYYQREA